MSLKINRAVKMDIRIMHVLQFSILGLPSRLAKPCMGQRNNPLFSGATGSGTQGLRFGKFCGL